MLNRFDCIKRKFAAEMLDCQMFKDKSKSPGGKGFRLKLHQMKPDAPLSPYYMDLRLIRSFPTTVKKTAVDLFEEMIREIPCDAVADVPTAITPIVSTLSDETQIPMITPRAPKDHGTGGDIDGVWQEEGVGVLLFDDLVTEAHSKLEAVRVLRAKKLSVEHIFVLLDREEGGKAQLSAQGLTLHSVFTISELLQLYKSMGTISQDIYEEIQAYRSSK